MYHNFQQELDIKIMKIGVNSKEWNKYEMIEFEYFEWAENGDLDALMEMSALELLKEQIKNIQMPQALLSMN